MTTSALSGRSAALVVAAAALACAHGAPATRSAGAREDVAVRAEIERTNAEFAAALVRGDAAAIAAMFTADGEVVPPALKGFVAGRAPLEAYYAARLRAARFLEVEIHTVSVEVHGDLAVELGTNRLVVQAGDAAPATRTARYVVVWRREDDGRWRIRVDAIVPDPAG